MLPGHYTSAQLYVDVARSIRGALWGNTVSLFFLKHEESGLETRFAGCSKRSRGRRAKIDEPTAYSSVRQSEAIKRNEAYGSFSATC